MCFQKTIVSCFEVCIHVFIIIKYFPNIIDCKPGEIKIRCLLPEDIPESNLDLSHLVSYHVDELKFWLSCRGDLLKKLLTKAACIQRCVSVEYVINLNFSLYLNFFKYLFLIIKYVYRINETEHAWSIICPNTCINDCMKGKPLF